MEEGGVQHISFTTAQEERSGDLERWRKDPDCTAVLIKLSTLGIPSPKVHIDLRAM